MELIESRRIWDRAPHNAFTDLIRFRDRCLCVFREGAAHVSPDGAFRVIASADGADWTPVARIASPVADLRDAKFSVTPDGRLMLCGAGAMHDKTPKSHQSLVWFSPDGETWSEPREIGEPNFWLWRVTWRRETAYAVGYAVGQERFVRLYTSGDGIQYRALVERLFNEGYPNEATLVFDGETAHCLLRRDGAPNTALWGVSQPPYTMWDWRDTGARFGGPNLLRLTDGRWLAAGRLYDGGARASLCWLDPQSGRLEEALRLPSGGDCSYPGLALHDSTLWVSYYSSHEGKAAIYLARVRIGQ